MSRTPARLESRKGCHFSAVALCVRLQTQGAPPRDAQASPVCVEAPGSGPPSPQPRRDTAEPVFLGPQTQAPPLPRAKPHRPGPPPAGGPRPPTRLLPSMLTLALNLRRLPDATTHCPASTPTVSLSHLLLGNPPHETLPTGFSGTMMTWTEAGLTAAAPHPSRPRVSSGVLGEARLWFLEESGCASRCGWPAPAPTCAVWGAQLKNL